MDCCGRTLRALARVRVRVRVSERASSYHHQGEPLPSSAGEGAAEGESLKHQNRLITAKQNPFSPILYPHILSLIHGRPRHPLALPLFSRFLVSAAKNR